jgi:hypothetical protein
MTNRTSILGGTNWADGEVLYAADLNDTVSGLVPKHYSFIGSFAGSGGFLGGSSVIPANAIGSIISLDIRTKVNFSANISGGGALNQYGYSRYFMLLINGSNFGYHSYGYSKYTLPSTNDSESISFNVFVGSISNTGSLNIQISGLAFGPVSAAGSYVYNYECQIFGNKFLQL